MDTVGFFLQSLVTDRKDDGNILHWAHGELEKQG
jgi:hypothetical protein